MLKKTDLQRRFDDWAFIALLAIIALSPLPLASNRPLVSAILTLASAATLLFASLATLVRDGPRAVTRPLIIASACFSMVGLWVLIQLATFLPAPLPHPLWGEASQILGRKIPPRITLDANLTWNTLLTTAGYFGLGLSTVLLVRDERRTSAVTLVLCATGGAYAFYGLVMWSSGLDLVLWYPNIDYPGVVTSTFINRNNYATYAGMVSLVSLGVVAGESAELRHIAGADAIQRIARTFEILFRRRWPYLLSLAFTLPALLFTLSRGGIASFFVGGSLLFLLLGQANVFRRSSRGRAIVAFGIAFACAIFLFDKALVERFSENGVTDNFRAESWSIIEDGIEASPFLGHGFGAFREGFPLYRDDRLPSRRFWDKAHNTYLELAFDLGIPAALTLVGGFFALSLQIAKGLQRRRRRRRAVPAVGLASIALAGSHSLVDFSLQIPADAAIFACIIGLAISESGIWRSTSKDERQND